MLRLCSIVISSFLVCMPSLASDWSFVKEKEQIKIYAKTNKSSPIKSLKAVGTIDAPIERVIALLRDVKYANTWVPNLVERSYVEKISDIEAVLYDVTDMPWPVADRELILHHRLNYSKDGRFLILTFESVKRNEVKVKKDFVRAFVHTGKVHFIPVSDSKTKLEVFLHVDPKGVIPSWVINLVQVEMPFELVKAIQNNVNKFQGKLLPGLKLMIDGLVGK